MSADVAQSLKNFDFLYIGRTSKSRTLGPVKTSHFFVYSRRATHDPHYTWHGDRRGPSRFLHSLTFFDLISSFAARGY